jgi:hypothetical protein
MPFFCSTAQHATTTPCSGGTRLASSDETLLTEHCCPGSPSHAQSFSNCYHQPTARQELLVLNVLSFLRVYIPYPLPLVRQSQRNNQSLAYSHKHCLYDTVTMAYSCNVASCCSCNTLQYMMEEPPLGTSEWHQPASCVGSYPIHLYHDLHIRWATACIYAAYMRPAG